MILKVYFTGIIIIAKVVNMFGGKMENCQVVKKLVTIL